MSNTKNKYGKPFEGYVNIKSEFFDVDINDLNVNKIKEIDDLYAAQPIRKFCKLCDTSLQKALFHRNSIKYFICKNCGHLNGEYEDTEEYCKQLYSPEKESDELQTYKDKDREAYNFRMNNIYLPKAKFLFDELSIQGLNPLDLSYIDIGSGAGHMVAAMKHIGIDKVIGYEVTKQNVDFANRMNNSEVLKFHSLEEINEIISNTTASVVTSIFMLEHVQKPYTLCQEIKKNKNIKYLLLAVPMFSIGVIIEQAFPHIRKRSLGTGHTHLFTEKSLKWLSKQIGFEILTNWWFGADAFDLHRYLNVHFRKDENKLGLADKWDELIAPLLNDIQLVFDKNKLSSEIHMFIKVNE